MNPLTAFKLFQDLNTEALDRLLERTETVKLPAGETLFREGDEGQELYLIQYGEIEVAKQSGAADQAVVLRVLSAGDWFGELGFLTDQTRAATIRAATDSLLLRMKRGALDAIDTPQAQLPASVVKRMMEELSRRIKDVDQRLLDSLQFSRGVSSPRWRIEEMIRMGSSVKINYGTNKEVRCRILSSSGWDSGCPLLRLHVSDGAWELIIPLHSIESIVTRSQFNPARC